MQLKTSLFIKLFQKGKNAIKVFQSQEKITFQVLKSVKNNDLKFNTPTDVRLKSHWKIIYTNFEVNFELF